MVNAPLAPHRVALGWVLFSHQIFFPVMTEEYRFVLGFHSIESPGRGNMYLATRDTTSFCGLFSFSPPTSSFFNYEWSICRLSLRSWNRIWSKHGQNKWGDFRRSLLQLSSVGEYQCEFKVRHDKECPVAQNFQWLRVSFRSNTEFKAGDTLRHVFPLPAVLDRVDYAIVYFNTARGGKSWSNHINECPFSLFFGSFRHRCTEKSRDRSFSFSSAIARRYECVSHRALLIDSLHILTFRYAGLCQTTVKIVTDTSKLIMLNRADCATWGDDSWSQYLLSLLVDLCRNKNFKATSITLFDASVDQKRVGTRADGRTERGRRCALESSISSCKERICWFDFSAKKFVDIVN